MTGKSSTALHSSEDVRPIDPNVKQWAASNPLGNVWVSASAGTGKTKVLSDRVLRLLLPRANGQLATPPHRILCLTYTKAAASEMTLRINKRLGEWVIMSDEDLKESLRRTIGEYPTQDIVNAARQLFAKVVDTPGGLKIMTIHAFCQSVLGRFPLEANISPQMDVLDERTATDILSQVLIKQLQGNEAAVTTAFKRLSIELSESQLMSKIKDCIQDGDQIRDFFTEHYDETAQKSALRDVYKAADHTELELLQKFIQSLNIEELKNFAYALSKGASRDQERAGILYDWVSSALEEQVEKYERFKRVFLTKKDEPIKKLSKGAMETLHTAEQYHSEICRSLLDLENQLKAVRLVHLTYDLLVLAYRVQQAYEAEKQQQGYLDYNDLIVKTVELLKVSSQSVPWVLYKLDGGLDHILVDEAQDTNPLQWDIISLLVEEFFINHEDESVRTLFVVGDEKQSIYRFQGADLEEFQYMRFLLSEKAKAAKAKWHNENLIVSFRSTRSVLKFVDKAFISDSMRRDIGVTSEEELEHISWRRQQAGRVSLWPPIIIQKEKDSAAWLPPTVIKDTRTPKAKLAEDIASQIQSWIKEERLLPSKNRPIQAGDILILVRRRDQFVENLIRSLKARSISVSGADRLILNHHIAVQDLISLAKFALQPMDDLSLAEILKSPFIGMDDQDLEDIAYAREGTLWEAIQQYDDKSIVDWLKSLLKAKNQSCFTFFFTLLNQPCPTDAISGLRALQARLGEECLDVIEEFLSVLQDYELEHSHSLQSFLVWQGNNPIEIKRELEEHGNSVRIMTVHGAKGLQAPIVFLPDTFRTKSSVQTKVPRLLMPRRTGAKTPIWSPRKLADCNAYTDYFDQVANQETAEYKRLFYVATTRAEDELIICGAMPASSVDDESWYYYAERAFENLGDEVEQQEHIIVYAHPQIGPAEEKGAEAQTYKPEDLSLPDWIYQSAPDEPTLPRPFRPSRPSEDEPATLSPRVQEDSRRFRRGLITHTLLQFLPTIPDSQREAAGKNYLGVQAKDFDEKEQVQILNEVLMLMRDTAFAEIFSSKGQSEVSVSGLLPDGRMISGQIDRILITDHEVFIIDYKTNRKTPGSPENVPRAYINQMTAYKQALEKIYPKKKIRVALLWTMNASLMELENL